MICNINIRTVICVNNINIRTLCVNLACHLSLTVSLFTLLILVGSICSCGLKKSQLLAIS